MKLTFVMNIPSPYRLHTFNMLWAECKKRGHELHVHFMNAGHKDRPKSWLNPQIDFPHTIWKNYGPDQHEWNPGLVRELLKNPPDWIHLGSPYDTFTCIALACLAKKSVLCAGCEGNTKTPGKMTGFIGWFKRFIFAKCPYATVPGADGARYIGLHQALTKKQMPKTILLPNLVDETRFKPSNLQLQLSTSTKKVIIPARLEPVKGLVPFIELLDKEMVEGWKIVIMGQGSLHDKIVALIKAKGLEDAIEILDYVPYEKMPSFYANADLLLLPSVYDPNPLSLIEAAHCGLPIAASDQCGNIEEAVSEGKNGIVLHVKDKVRFVEDLKRVFALTREQLTEMGKWSKEHNAKFWDSELPISKYLDEVEKSSSSSSSSRKDD